MNNKIKILIIMALFAICLTTTVSAWVISIPWWDIEDVSTGFTPMVWDPVANINTIWFSILNTVKIVLEGVLFIFMVYIWIQMIMAMGSDEESLTSSKRQIWYTLIALVFINIPWTLYYSFYNDTPTTIWKVASWSWVNSWAWWNIFLNIFAFWDTINNKIIAFIEILIFAIAVFMIILAWIKIMTARWKDEAITEWKNKIIFSIISILLVWFIESWKYIAFNWKISDWVNFFATLANLALFFAWPVAIFFLTLAWYFFITANWDEERIKKAKSIVINIVIATLILLASYTFLLDLATL